VSFVRSRVAGISITSVEEVIAESYSQLFSMSVDVIYNAPDRNDLRPTPVQADAIRLVHHGMGTKGKGIEETICALNFLDSRYSLDLILFATPQFKLKIELLSRILGVRNRINILRGVPLSDLPLVLNRYDVAIVLLSDVTPGHWNSLPNKLFESIHSKLAIVTGPNPSMRRIVEQGRVGVALPSWSPKALSAVLSSWTASDIWKFKENTTSASAVLSSDQSKVVFARIVRKLEAEAREGK
jgi:glycosyltransferase involved in cell wall biosynthesis